MPEAHDVLAMADRLWRGEVTTADVHPLRPEPGLAEVADGVAFVPSFANVSAVDTEDGLVLVDTGSAFLAADVHRILRGLVARPAQHRRLLPRPHRPRLRRPGVGGRVGRRRMAGTGGGGARGPARPVRPVHPDRRLQRHHQPAAVRHRLAAMADRVPLPRPHLPRPPRPRRRRHRRRLHHAKGETDDHTWTWFPDRGCSAAATCSSGRRPTPATPRRCSDTRSNGPMPSARCSPCSTRRAGARGPAARARIPSDGRGTDSSGPR